MTRKLANLTAIPKQIEPSAKIAANLRKLADQIEDMETVGYVAAVMAADGSLYFQHETFRGSRLVLLGALTDLQISLSTTASEEA